MLWSVVLLALLATGITAAGRSDVQLATNIRQRRRRPGRGGCRHRAGGVPRQRRARAGLARRRPPSALPFGGYTLTLRIADENRKVNPNLAPPDLMAALLAASGADPPPPAGIAQAIADWHAPARTDAAAAQYRAAGHGRRPGRHPVPQRGRSRAW